MALMESDKDESLFIDGLVGCTTLQIMSADDLSGFVHDVFGNMKEIFSLHQQLLHALFERQCEQHPVLQTVADIVLDSVSLPLYLKHFF